MDISTVAGGLILGFLLPIWVVFGVADWAHHRATNIEHTAGWRESFMHLMLIGQAGVAVLAGLFLEINALVLGTMIVLFLLHEATTYWDVGYAAPKRFISPSEQRVHDYLTAIPFAALLIVCLIHPGQFAALFALGTEKADFSVRWKSQPLPLWYLVLWLPISFVNAIVYLQEFARCVRAEWQRTRHRAA
jgi:hypothetical protein